MIADKSVIEWAMVVLQTRAKDTGRIICEVSETKQSAIQLSESLLVSGFRNCFRLVLPARSLEGPVTVDGSFIVLHDAEYRVIGFHLRVAIPSQFLKEGVEQGMCYQGVAAPLNGDVDDIEVEDLRPPLVALFDEVVNKVPTTRSEAH